MTRITVPHPDRITTQRGPNSSFVRPDAAGIEVVVAAAGDGLTVHVSAPSGVARIALRWFSAPIPGSVVLGDAWERSYGDLEWRSIRAERILPWTALVHDRRSGRTTGFGVEVRGGAFAFWQVDNTGVTLVLDLRSGAAAVRPGTRTIHAATVRWIESDEGAFAAHRELCSVLCTDPIRPDAPLVGANNWYYAYGKDFGLDAVIRDARMISDLSGDHPNRPYGVIDDGWSIDGTADGLASSAGPWDRGRPGTFPDMAEAAAAIAAEGARPGIWFRPLLTRDESLEGITTTRAGGRVLDPSSPAVLDLVERDIRRLADWGFDLIKHDFSTFDLLGHWGPDLGMSAPTGPALHDPSMTTAEVLVGLYRRIHEASGSTAVLGCDVVGHLAAGLVEAQRTGDDTSGLDWDRTRRVGVNTLAFRLAQHESFFTVDPDCVPCTPATDWAYGRRFLDLVARSGTALFVSVDPRSRTDAVDDDLAAALRIALDGGTPGGLEPLDWLDDPTPRAWRSSDRTHEYEWVSAAGADPFEQSRNADPLPED